MGRAGAKTDLSRCWISVIMGNIYGHVLHNLAFVPLAFMVFRAVTGRVGVPIASIMPGFGSWSGLPERPHKRRKALARPSLMPEALSGPLWASMGRPGGNPPARYRAPRHGPLSSRPGKPRRRAVERRKGLPRQVTPGKPARRLVGHVCGRPPWAERPPQGRAGRGYLNAGIDYLGFPVGNLVLEFLG